MISARAKHGLDISPVPLATAGLTGAELERVGQGSYLVNAIAGCGDCHNTPGPGLKFLAGGTTFPTDATHTVTSRNLTPDATGLKLTEAQFIEVLRTGKDFSSAGGTGGLQVMPWDAFRWMSTDDMRAIYAYLKVIPGVSNTPAPDNKVPSTPVAYTATYTDGDSPDHPLPPETDPTDAGVPDPDYVLRGLSITPLATSVAALSATDVGKFGRGSYLVNAIADCNGCHTNTARAGGKVNFAQYLGGGRVFPTPPPLQPVFKTTRAMSASLLGTTTGFINDPAVNFGTFLTALTEGIHADESPPRPLAFPMPWRIFRHMQLDDLESIYTYLKAVGAQHPRPDKPVQDYAKYCAAAGDCDAANGETCDMTNHECVGHNCATTAQCPVCQTCTANGNTQCALLTGAALGGCIGAGL